MLTNYNFYSITALNLVSAFINSKVTENPLINLFFKFILQFENYWMIINADPI